MFILIIVTLQMFKYMNSFSFSILADGLLFIKLVILLVTSLIHDFLIHHI